MQTERCLFKLVIFYYRFNDINQNIHIPANPQKRSTRLKVLVEANICANSSSATRGNKIIKAFGNVMWKMFTVAEYSDLSRRYNQIPYNTKCPIESYIGTTAISVGINPA